MGSIKDMFDSVDADEDSGGSRRDMDHIKDGTYKASVTDFSVFSDEKGDFYVSWWFEVTDGAAAGAQLQSFSSVGPYSVKFIKRSISRVIGKTPSWEELYDEESGRTGVVRGLVVGREVQITQKTKNSKGKDYVNVYVDKVINSAPAKEAAPAEPEAESKEDDDEVDVDDLF